MGVHTGEAVVAQGMKGRPNYAKVSAAEVKQETEESEEESEEEEEESEESEEASDNETEE